jgi:hypothetical protein
MWHARLARVFTCGAPVPLFQTEPLPGRTAALRRKRRSIIRGRHPIQPRIRLHLRSPRQYNTEPDTPAPLFHFRCAPVAQRLEQQTHNLLVRGSNPCGGTNQLARVLKKAMLQIMVDPTGLKPAPHGLKGRRSVTRAPGQYIADFRLLIADCRMALARCIFVPGDQSEIWQSEIGNVLAAATRLELVSSRLQDERSVLSN